ncbi:hypothetical protein EAE96_003661 [Botrytis aclada]|nr:hypothetical protein EAE96_003661 [Botrytis aclada]
MPEFNFASKLVKLEQSLPYIISPALILSLVLQKFIKFDKSDADAIFWAQICFSINLCYFVYRQPNAQRHRSLIEVLDEKAN